MKSSLSRTSVRAASRAIASMLVALPLSDLALDGFGDVGADQSAYVIGELADQLGARALDDRFQALRQLLLEAAVGEQIQPLQHLHRNLLGQRAPVLLVGDRALDRSMGSRYGLAIHRLA